jgi:hypothetical protein
MAMVLGRLVVIGDFDVVGIAIFPAEADAPLLVDSDTELAEPVAFESFQPIGGRNFQILQDDSLTDHRELV